MKITCLTKHVILLIILFSILSSLQGQVTIGSSMPPVHGALLDVKSKNSSKGMGLPRVNLTKVKKLYPMFWDKDANSEVSEYTTNEITINEEHTGLLVYNVTKNYAENLYPGMYVWNGTQWIPLFQVSQPTIGPNSYIIKPNSKDFEIPLYKAFVIWEKYGSRFGAVDFENATTFEAKILWEEGDLISNHDNSPNFLLPIEGTSPEGVIKINTTGNEGNALVAFLVDGIVRWSWHIWVTDYDPDNGGVTYTYNNGYNNYIWMDRNLGAKAAIAAENPKTIGLYYLFGRKDPSPRLANFSGSKPTNLMGAMLPDYKQNKLNDFNQPFDVTYANSIKNPWAYIGGGGETGEWYQFSPNQTLDKNFYFDIWGQESNCKSLFDPCPEGWCVPRVYPPSYDVQNNLSKNNWPFLYNGLIAGTNTDYGYSWNQGAIFGERSNFQMGYFPATGHLNSLWNLGEPSLDNVGSECLLLTASRGQLDHMGNVSVISISQNKISSTQMQTGTGMNVRCVKE